MNHETDAYAVTLGSAGTHTGIIAPNPAWFNTPSIAEVTNNMHQFGVRVCENGYTINHRGKEYICGDVKEVGDRLVAILVEERLSK